MADEQPQQEQPKPKRRPTITVEIHRDQIPVTSAREVDDRQGVRIEHSPEGGSRDRIVIPSPHRSPSGSFLGPPSSQPPSPRGPSPKTGERTGERGPSGYFVYETGSRPGSSSGPPGSAGPSSRRSSLVIPHTPMRRRSASTAASEQTGQGLTPPSASFITGSSEPGSQPPSRPPSRRSSWEPPQYHN
jgi:hypothetical protein